MVWRGPMATKALDKLLFGTEWGRLDALVIDMPPGQPRGGDQKTRAAGRAPSPVPPCRAPPARLGCGAAAAGGCLLAST